MDNQGWRDKLDKFKLPIGLAVVGLVLIVGGIFASGLQKTSPEQFPKESLIDSQKLISVDVSGAVKTPGVYQLKNGSRIEDAITAAAGFSGEANQEYISKYLNMAQKLSDGSKVYVPLAGEEATRPISGATVAGAATAAKVNINTANQTELEALPGIGPVTASKIISDRPYREVGELLNKKVVNKSTFEKIKDQLVVY